MDPLLDFLFGVFSSVAQVWLICGEACFGLLLIAVFLTGVWGLAFAIRVTTRRDGHSPEQNGIHAGTRTQRPARWTVRAASLLIDVSLSSAGPLIVLASTYSTMRWHDANGFMGSWSGPHYAVDPLLWWTFGIGLSAGCIVWWALALPRAQTPAKWIFGVRAIQAATGQPLGWRMMFLRELVLKPFPFWISPSIYMSVWYLAGVELIADLIARWPGAAFMNNFFFATVLVTFVIMVMVVFPFDCLWPLWDDDDQTLHDKVAGTRVIRG